jgi:hypothetical protein
MLDRGMPLMLSVCIFCLWPVRKMFVWLWMVFVVGSGPLYFEANAGPVLSVLTRLLVGGTAHVYDHAVGMYGHRTIVQQHAGRRLVVVVCM